MGIAAFTGEWQYVFINDILEVTNLLVYGVLP